MITQNLCAVESVGQMCSCFLVLRKSALYTC
jgi:hypothetical protein